VEEEEEEEKEGQEGGCGERVRESSAPTSMRNQ